MGKSRRRFMVLAAVACSSLMARHDRSGCCGHDRNAGQVDPRDNAGRRWSHADRRVVLQQRLRGCWKPVWARRCVRLERECLVCAERTAQRRSEQRGLLRGHVCIAVGSHRGKAQAWSWNGTMWSAQATFNPKSSANSLSAIRCSAGTSSCEAVGYSSNGGSTTLPLAEYWNGKAWTDQSTPGALPGELSAVSCESRGASLGPCGRRSGRTITRWLLWRWA